MSGDRAGLATAAALAMQEHVGAAGGASQVELFDDVDADVSLPTRAKSGAKGGRPAGSRNRSTEEWRRMLLSRYPSPLIGLAETYSRPVDELARELGLFKRGKVFVDGPDGGAWVEREDPEQLDLERAFRLQQEARQALAPYVHQRQPLAIESKGSQRGLLVIGDLTVNAAFAGDQLPLAEPKENQQVIEGEAIKSDGMQSDEAKIASNGKGLGNADD